MANLIHGETVTLSNGTQVVYGGIAGADGIGRLNFDAQGNVQSAATTLDIANVFAASVSAVAAIKVGDAQYVLTASGTENGVSVWDVSNTGSLTHTDSLGIDDGLWVDAPTAMEVATIGTQTYIVLTSAGSSSLSVMALDMAGELTVTDHVIDSRNSRFASASALTIVEHHGNIYVIVGGADDGISVFLLRADGTLLARGHLADTTQMSLENVSAISAVSVGDGIDIFVASSQVSGVTQLHFDTGPAGTTIQANAAGETVSGTDGMDILTGVAGDDRLSGGGGDDVLTDGAGADRLTGGAGADTFIFVYNTATDIITDFTVGVDQIDLSAWPELRSNAQLTFTSRSDGVRISYGDDVLIVKSADGQPIDPANFNSTDLIGDTHIPQNITQGYSGPITAVPDLPERPDYTPYIYTPVPVDPNAEGGLDIPSYDRSDSNTSTAGVVVAGSVITGSSGGDILTATSEHLIIYGGAGADTLFGSGGADKLYGGRGADVIYGRGGADRIWGNKGDDRLFGNRGADKIKGGSGDDLLKGGSGADKLKGNGGDDKLKGGGGNDMLIGHKGGDKIFGGSGADKLKGNGGADTLIGNKGSDKIFGGAGSDTLNGNKGNDVMKGGGGADTFIFNDGHDRIKDFSIRSDQLRLDDKNWHGQLSAAQVVNRYASVQDGDTVFDFGGNDQLTLTGITNLDALIAVISIV